MRQLSVYPQSPTSVVLSWQRPYHVTFRKYVLQMFFFNPVTLTSEWTTYYEIAATASVIASVVALPHSLTFSPLKKGRSLMQACPHQAVTDLLPAWYYNFRVAMVTWGDPPLSCCDSSTISFVTGTHLQTRNSFTPLVCYCVLKLVNERPF